MKQVPSIHRALAALALVLALDCAAQLPQRNLELRLRQVDSEQALDDVAAARPRPAEVTVSTRRLEADRPAIQQLKLLNGQWGSVRVGWSQPMQWTRAVAGAASAPGGVAGAVIQELIGLHAGQSLTVRARWPGGKRPALVDIQVDLAQVGERQGDALPATSQSRAATTVLVPLDRWTSFASSQPDPGLRSADTVSTEHPQAHRAQVFQVLVHAL